MKLKMLNIIYIFFVKLFFKIPRIGTGRKRSPVSEKKNFK